MGADTFYNLELGFYRALDTRVRERPGRTQNADADGRKRQATFARSIIGFLTGDWHQTLMKAFLVATALAAIVASTPGSAKATKVNHFVEVDGTRYRVAVYNNEIVLVANKSLVVAYDPYERDRQRKAVVEATGCKVVDELPSNDGKTRGKLDCSEKVGG